MSLTNPSLMRRKEPYISTNGVEFDNNGNLLYKGGKGSKIKNWRRIGNDEWRNIIERKVVKIKDERDTSTGGRKYYIAYPYQDWNGTIEWYNTKEKALKVMKKYMKNH